MRVLLIDNYDSFTYNIVECIHPFVHDILVRRNDSLTVASIRKLHPDRIIISPGPGRPEEAKLSLQVLEHFKSQLPILGICLGHQVIGYYFNSSIINAPAPMHGKTISIQTDGKTLFKGLPTTINVGLYNSLIVSNKKLHPELEISAYTETGVIMGLRHRYLSLEGVQFHPDSILTQQGRKMFKNWILKKW